MCNSTKIKHLLSGSLLLLDFAQSPFFLFLFDFALLLDLTLHLFLLAAFRLETGLFSFVGLVAFFAFALLLLFALDIEQNLSTSLEFGLAFVVVLFAFILEGC